MKKILLFSFIVLCNIGYSQVTLTQQANEPKPSDLERTFELDTSAFTNGLPLNVVGNNVVWNFTNLVALQPEIENYYFSAGSVPSSSAYPGCSFVQESGNVYSYFKSTTTPVAQTEILGIKSNTLSVNFSNSAILVKYPVSYGYSLTDNISGTFNFSVSGTCSGSITTVADGSGTLNLPEGVTLTNVLRVKSVQTLTMTAFFTQLAVLRHSVYNYYHTSQKFPVLSVTYDYLTSSLTSTPSITGFATGSINYFVTGIKETTLKSTDVVFYPNPVQTNLNIDITGNFNLNKIVLYNQLGELVLKTGNKREIDVSGLKSGVYFIEVSTDTGIVRKKIMKE